MAYTFAAIVEQEDVDETWVPRITDKAGTVAWSRAEGSVKSFGATGMTVYRGQADKGNRLLHITDVSFTVHISDARFVAVCRKFDKGGGWVGGLTAMVVFNAVSKARAAARSHGKFLVGQMRWPWLSDVGYTEKYSWASDSKLRLVAKDGDGALILADFVLPKDVSAKAIAEHVIARAAKVRGTATPALPAYDRTSNKFALATLPGAQPAIASTAKPTSAPAAGLKEVASPNSTEATTQSAACPHCGTNAETGARFCRGCGGSLETEGAP